MHTVIIIDEESGNVNEYNHVPDLRVTATTNVEPGSTYTEFEMGFTLANPDDVLAYNLTSKKRGAYGDIL